MIYSTMCIGNEWVTKFKDSINKFGKDNTLYILTDLPEEFPNCETILYTRNEFSYYEKINLILDLLDTHKERITYIDADWLKHYNTNISFSDDCLYTYQIFYLNTKPIMFFFPELELKKINKIVNLIGLEKFGNTYIPEAVLSFPYFNEFEEIKNDFNIMQNPIEDIYNKEVPVRTALRKYSKHGIGYGEGLAITAVADKYNLCVKDFGEFPNYTWRKKVLL